MSGQVHHEINPCKANDLLYECVYKYSYECVQVYLSEREMKNIYHLLSTPLVHTDLFHLSFFHRENYITGGQSSKNTAPPSPYIQQTNS